MNLINKADFTVMVAAPQTLGHRKLNSFAKLKKGWNYGEGKEFSSVRINKAKQIDNILVQLLASPTDAFPGSDGQIMVTAYKGPYYLEYTLHDDNNFSMRTLKGSTVVSNVSYVNQGTALSNLAKTAEHIWGTFGSSTPNFTMITVGTSSIDSPLMVCQTAGLPSSGVTASTQQANPGVSTSASITPVTHLSSPLSSGTFIAPSFPQDTK